MYSPTEQLLIWLEKLGYAAFMYPPKDAPSEFVTVERTGGGMADVVDHPTMAIQTWAQTAERAERMAIEIRNATLTSRPYGYAAMSVNAGAYPFYDDDTRCPRFQTVYECTTIAV